MKKILFAIAIVLTIGLTASAQNTDSFVDWENDWGNRTGASVFPSVPYSALGITNNVNSEPLPLGSGLLVLTALGAGYAVARKNRKK